MSSFKTILASTVRTMGRIDCKCGEIFSDCSCLQRFDEIYRLHGDMAIDVMRHQGDTILADLKFRMGRNPKRAGLYICNMLANTVNWANVLENEMIYEFY